MDYHKPIKTLITPDKLSTLRGDYRYEEKLDGQFAIREMGRSVIAGEQMRDGRFIAFDCLVLDGQDIRRACLRDRLECLNRFSFPRPQSAQDASELFSRVIGAGGEGIVCKDLSAPYGEMLACKRSIEIACSVIGFCGGSQSVVIVDAATGDDRGKVALRGGKVDRVRIGSIIKVIGMNLTELGMIREPRICADSPESWLVKY